VLHRQQQSINHIAAMEGRKQLQNACGVVGIVADAAAKGFATPNFERKGIAEGGVHVPVPVGRAKQFVVVMRVARRETSKRPLGSRTALRLIGTVVGEIGAVGSVI
jgi:hypothetical protein